MSTTQYSKNCRRFVSTLYFPSDDVISSMTSPSQTTLWSSTMPSSAPPGVFPQNVMPAKASDFDLWKAPQISPSPGDTATPLTSSSPTSSQDPFTSPPAVFRQEIRIESVTVLFPACIATSYVIHLKYYENGRFMNILSFSIKI